MSGDRLDRLEKLVGELDSALAAVINDGATRDGPTLASALSWVYQRVGYVQKGGRTTFGDRYSYAGEADLIRAIRPVMAEAGLVGPFPVRVEHAVHDHAPTRKGVAQTRHEVVVVYRLLHGPSGEHVDIMVPGIGIDSGDKGTAKAMTGAYKYALRQLWCIETGDDPDDTPSAAQESRVEAPHDAEWDGDRARFCARLRELGVEYDRVKAWALAAKLSKPSTWGAAGRASFLTDLADGRVKGLT